MSNKLRYYRREQDISQSELAKRVGVTRLTISNIETGKTKDPATSIALKIADSLGISVGTIFGTGNENQGKREAAR